MSNTKPEQGTATQKPAETTEPNDALTQLAAEQGGGTAPAGTPADAKKAQEGSKAVEALQKQVEALTAMVQNQAASGVQAKKPKEPQVKMIHPKLGYEVEIKQSLVADATKQGFKKA